MVSHVPGTVLGLTQEQSRVFADSNGAGCNKFEQNQREFFFFPSLHSIKLSWPCDQRGQEAVMEDTEVLTSDPGKEGSNH